MSAASIAKKGNSVVVHYTGTLTSGDQFDSSIGSDPLEFILGEGMMIAGFDAAVLGMKIGEKKTVTIPSADAYGEISDDNIISIPKRELPDGMTVTVGTQLQMEIGEEGQVIPVIVTEVGDKDFTIDGNHDLAGQELTFEIELIEILG